MKYYDKLIFELSVEGRQGWSLPENSWEETPECGLPETLRRETPIDLPQVSEPDTVRHYVRLSGMNFGVDTGFYPLGSCTMKYNPKIGEEVASHPGFASLHPLQPAETVQGALRIYAELSGFLCALTGMSAFTLNPFAGAHGELTGLMIMRRYHISREDFRRTRIIVPDSAHGTNPASAAVCGLQVVEVRSTPQGLIDINDLKPLLDDTVAGIMMTNPNTLGLFETEIKEIAASVHAAGGLLYYDGANMNALLGKVRPGDMGFDIMHLNLHKTFSTPHGGGGPGAGPVGVAGHLAHLLPSPTVRKAGDRDEYEIAGNPQGPGRISGFTGNFGVLMKAYAYILMLGKQNIGMVGPLSVLAANYVKESLKDRYRLPIDSLCKHEFVFDGLIQDNGDTPEDMKVTTLDVAKRLLDYGFHSPTVYFPLLFHQSIMIEPTETESKETLDAFIEAMRAIADEAVREPELLKGAPHDTPVRRPDETLAATHPVLVHKGRKEESR